MNRSQAANLLQIPIGTTSAEEIGKAYKKLAKKHHPDVGGNEHNFKLLGEAKEEMLKPIQNPRQAIDDLFSKMNEALKEDMRKQEAMMLYRSAAMKADMSFGLIMAPLVISFMFTMNYFWYTFPIMLFLMIANVRIRKLLTIYNLKKIIKKKGYKS